MRNVSISAHRFTPGRIISNGGTNVRPDDFVCNMDHCEVRIADDVGIFLCERHLQKAWAAYQIKMGAHVPAERPERSADLNDINTVGTVYVVRVGDLIKIGWTSDPQTRFKSLGVDAVLHMKQGSRKDEFKLQAQFLDHLAKGREWFECNVETLRLVENLRAGRLAA